ncbi:MAG TPA: class I SAM-dependent DNA methyltransferase [Polyangiaceae bacterium]|nr:class I SAM-dependent DNA methyltransferase [Polyangiaceae bacterium]
MVQKRDVLQLLGRDELVAIVDRFELSPPDRRVKDGLIESVATSKKATLSEILPGLSRDRLKEICRALEVDASGREKAALIERLLAGKAAESAEKNASPTNSAAVNGAHTNGAGKRGSAPPRAPEPVEVQPGEKLSVDKLERYLWSAADILRGSIDSSDYKNYIFGLLFLKRLSDRFEEECEALVRDGDDPEDRDNHQFFVPKRARWPEIQKVATDLGSALNKACARLEEANGSLEGVLAGIDYNDERKLGDARARDVVLGRLVQHFSRLSLKNANLSEPDMLGRAYEYLIEQFADDAGKKGGEFYTPRMVVRLIVELLAPAEGMRICDPTAGSGGMLIECAHYLERHGQDQRNLSLFGQEKNLGTWAICKMNMLLHGFPDARIEKGDTIRDPKLREDGELMLFDRVIANPPFSLDEWGREIAEHDPFSRFRFGVPPKSKGDLAFVQHMVSTSNTSGVVGVVMPHGVLFRGGAEGEIRRGFLQEDLVEAVVGLPTNLFYGTGIPAAVLILNRGKSLDRKHKVLFVEASRDFSQGQTQSYLSVEHVAKIVAAYRGFANVEKYARVVPLTEIEKSDWSLNISRYVETADAVEKVDVRHAIAKLRQLEHERAEAEATLNGYLRELGYDS